MSVINVQSVSKTFKSVKALDDVSLTIEKGHIYGLLGGNGAGKTTLFNIISDREIPSSGSIMLDGQPVKESSDLLRKMYFTGAENILPAGMRLRDAVDSLKYFYKNADKAYAEKLFASFGIDSGKRFSELSTGSYTLAGAVLALASGADFIFLDEPTLGVDANNREMFYRLLLERFLQTESAFIIATHLIDECAGLLEHCFVLKKGKIIADDECEALMESAYVVEGNAVDVDGYAEGKEVLNRNSAGSLASVCIKGEPEDIPETLSFSRPSLQKLIVSLTGGGSNA
ncbi:ABC transporter ATP-binding protein [Ruminococcus sp. HUN007]|uniref:ATP-binding cassette domain-containing protein n=1 Tax=Ruminococcus sp. HUN007 TaxID=1514668 RepID=UPI0005D23303|nr:ABC transporter ATP-binding protein [Ruminococcus sp. HUN007]